MITLILGGSSSGKSLLAETAAQFQANGPLFYIATMQVYGEEGRKRVERHRLQRAGKGFETVERFLNIGGLTFPQNSTLLIECMSNLLANEIFDPQGSGEQAVEKIFAGVNALAKQAENLVIVSNDVFSDGIAYEESSMDYIRKLGELNRLLAALADTVIESVVGIPIYHKGGPYGYL